MLAVADVLVAHDLPPRTRELAEIIVRSGRDLLELLNELLDFSRIESGALAIRSEPFSLGALLRSVDEVWRVAAATKGLEFVLANGASIEELVGDEARLRQVLSNLLNNAVKFTAAGRVTLDVQAWAAAPGFAALRFTVSDTGPGLDDAARERLFQPFASGLSEGAREGAGAGLGLAICRELIGLMRGSIRCEQAASGGAAFVVELELPLAERDGCDAGQNDGASLELPPLRVLVAEDHPVNRRVIGLLLDQLGADYLTVEDGAQAVAAAAAERFDAILMDVRMPVMDGLEATRAIRAAGSRTPVIAVTADATVEQEAAMREAGMDGILPKPISLSGLVEALGRVNA